MEEMLEKQITLLIPKSSLEEFEKVANGFNQFTVNQYCEDSSLESTVNGIKKS